MAGLNLSAWLAGGEAVRHALAQIAQQAPQAVARALYQQGVDIWGDAIRRAPVEFGVLRSSGYASPPITDGEGTWVQVGFGVKYAIYQHEGDYQHPRGGERYFLRNAVEARASLAKVAAWARENLAKGLGSEALPVGPPPRPKVVERARARAAVRRASMRVKSRKE